MLPMGPRVATKRQVKSATMSVAPPPSVAEISAEADEGTSIANSGPADLIQRILTAIKSINTIVTGTASEQNRIKQNGYQSYCGFRAKYFGNLGGLTSQNYRQQLKLKLHVQKQK
ncbi:hypothetical protein EVAR_79824_1 [Eumeta japonica]|uniref:Uncharacterized protein n=1 Tax=Eumeta variegata TaxID=151549 RepID=A0A4C1WTY5_EUMVA|nr:hypothetical protein EVAR_79824_1 [Eumeta japonica]